MSTEYTFTCATCDHVIAGRPVFHLGLAFCCAGCAADGPCMCSYDAEPLPPPAVVAPAVVAPDADANPAEEPAVTEEPIAVASAEPVRDLVGAGR